MTHSVNDIRSAFLSFFKRHDHQILPSSPLVPQHDPTLMFTNAGMVPFKNVFTGLEKPSHPRATTSQKCVRAGGKHNDLDNVGYTARHHTFFEMLGNFSFGDYFKEHAIELAWQLVTREFSLPESKLLVTVYAEDEEAARLWKTIAGLPEERILKIATSDNFWSMGDTGPCGPCSEIFYDHGEHIPGGPPGSPDEDGDRFIEIWNLVFMQYNQTGEGERQPLPRPSIDTGMGLERMAAVLQGVHDNYDIDLFQALIAASEAETSVSAKDEARFSHRVIADHIRSCSFLIADGVLPANEGRGYVLRRIMRRAMRHAHLLGAKDPLMHRLVQTLCVQMGQAYPELLEARALIEETLLLEETRFRATLERGLKLLDEATSGLRSGDKLDGQTAFKLYDTYGFPLDLTEDALRSRNIAVDTQGFHKAMESQKQEARAAWAGSGDQATESIWYDLRDRLALTEFLGYEHTQGMGVVEALVQDGQEVDSLTEGQEGAVVTNQTPFYAQSGGQIGDRGVIEKGECRFLVEDVQKKADGLYIHRGRVEKGTLTRQMSVSMAVDAARRAQICQHHSATHLLHEALRRTLGDHVAQKGSLVAEDRLRFDISHPKPISDRELDSIAEQVNAMIVQNSAVETRVMPVDEARQAGARALFGEKYGDEVRVVSMGLDEGALGEGQAAAHAPSIYSMELCGGTHVKRTGDIGLLHIVSESGVSSGVRRIEALAGEAARQALEKSYQAMQAVAGQLKILPDQVPERLDQLLSERKKLEEEVSQLRRKLALAGEGGADQSRDNELEQVGNVAFSALIIDGIPMKDLKPLADEAKSRIQSGVVVVLTRLEGGKSGLVIGVTEDLTGKISAVELVRAGSEALGGKGGGGRPDLAQAGGPDGSKAHEAVAAIKSKLLSLQ
jgi:alanyl-tRNA synthetase